MSKNRNLQVAAAVALAIGSVGAAYAQTPTYAQCAAPNDKLYVAGSSAAKASFQAAFNQDLFTAPGINFSSTNGDFEAFCGFAKGGNGANLPANDVVTVFYRAEGGSVVGALPIYSGKPVNFLDLTGTNCAVLNPATTGTSASVGTFDGWGGCVTTHGVELGVTDLEPGVFKATNYPSSYSTAVFGSATASQLAGLAHNRLFDQVFGLFVNTSGINGGGTGQAIDITTQTAAAILSGSYTDWDKVPTASGGRVSTSSVPITLVNREAGSGTRTGASIYFLGVGCVTYPGSIYDPAPSEDGYATSAVLATAATTPGAITYASIDNNGKQANLSMASLNGVTPSNLAATSGEYGWWFEATAQPGNTTGTSGGITSPNGATIANWLQSSTGGELQKVATAPHAVDILAVPAYGNTAVVPVVPSFANSHTIYVNPFTRAGNSCAIPSESN